MKELTQDEVADIALSVGYGIANPREQPPTYEMRRAMEFYRQLRAAMLAPAPPPPPVWQPFWFETNEVWGLVDDQDAWNNIRLTWESANKRFDDSIYELTNTRPGYDAGSPPEPPSFGSRDEHVGGVVSLRQFFEARGIPLTRAVM